MATFSSFFSLLKGKVSSEHHVGQVARSLATLMSGYDKPMGNVWAPRHTPHCGRLAVMHLDTLSMKTPYNDSPSVRPHTMQDDDACLPCILYNPALYVVARLVNRCRASSWTVYLGA